MLPPEPKDDGIIIAELRQEMNRFTREQLEKAETLRPGYTGEGCGKPNEKECRFHEGQAAGARHCDDYLRALLGAAIEQYERVMFGGGPYLVEGGQSEVRADDPVPSG